MEKSELWFNTDSEITKRAIELYNATFRQVHHTDRDRLHYVGALVMAFVSEQANVSELEVLLRLENNKLAAERDGLEALIRKAVAQVDPSDNPVMHELDVATSHK